MIGSVVVVGASLAGMHAAHTLRRDGFDGRITVIDGEARRLPEPFFVIATQNPSYQVGTYPLPESQLDRFLMRIELGYPAASLERQLLLGRDRRDLLDELAIAITPQQLLRLQGAVPQVHASAALLDYVQAVARYTRQAPEFEAGLSPRAVIALLRAASSARSAS